MFTYIPSASILKKILPSEYSAFIFAVWLSQKVIIYLCIVHLSIVITEERYILLLGQDSGRQSPASHRESSSRSQVSSCEIYGGSGTGFSPSDKVFPFQYHPTNPTHSPLSTFCCYLKDKTVTTKSLPKAMLFRKFGRKIS
jgi:hypothetical protein